MIKYIYNATENESKYEIIEMNNTEKAVIIDSLKIYDLSKIQKLYEIFKDSSGINIILEDGTLYKNAILLIKVNDGYCFVSNFSRNILRFIQKHNTCLVRNNNMKKFDEIKSSMIYEIESNILE